jgi:HSP20 family protein
MGLKLYESRPMRVFEDVFNDRVSPFFSSIMTPAIKNPRSRATRY